MGPRIAGAARLATAVLLAVGAFLAPGVGARTPVALAANCPSPPITIAKLIGSGERSPGRECFGGRLLTFRAHVDPPCDGCGGTEATVISPLWLDGLGGSVVNLSAGSNGPQISAYVPPALGRCRVDDNATCPFRFYWGRWATVSAHFDGPVAQTCSYSEHPPGPEFTKQAAVAECRDKLIVLSVGFGDLPATDTAVTGRPAGEPPSSLPQDWSAIVGVVALIVAWRLLASRRLSTNRRPAR